MFCLPLLQTSPQNPPYAIYATLAVGVLSLIASGLNIYFSSKTAQKVVNLSTKTTREVAELSAQVSRESAGLAAQTARELKEKDYKNDFYKRLLDKGLYAWAEAEQLFLPMRASATKVGDGNVFAFLFDEEVFYDTIAKINKIMVSQFIWMGEKYNRVLIDFRNTLLDIKEEYVAAKGVNNKLNLDDKNALLVKIGVAKYDKMSKLYSDLVTELSIILATLHDIDGFLAKKEKGQV